MKRSPTLAQRHNGLVIVTGASRGIGRATALSLALDHGVHVLAIGRDGAALKTLREEVEKTGSTMELANIDLEDGPAVEQVVDIVAGRRILALIHNAGLLVSRPFGAHSSGELERVFRVNALVPLLLSQALAEGLAGEPAGHIVHIGSMGGFQDSVKFPGLAAYSASKAALVCIAQCLAVEFSGRGICSNCLALGAVDTDMLRTAFPGYRAPITASEMGAYIAEFALSGHKLYNGKVLPVALSTP